MERDIAHLSLNAVLVGKCVVRVKSICGDAEIYVPVLWVKEGRGYRGGQEDLTVWTSV